MNIARIQFPVFNPYNKSALEIYFSGCNGCCMGCHNPELKDFDLGLNWRDKLNYILNRKYFFEIISFLGGEPLDQDKIEMQRFIQTLRSLLKNKEFWLFTRYEIEEVPLIFLQYFDYIKTGKYDILLSQEGFPASSNQRLLKKGQDY